MLRPFIPAATLGVLFLAFTGNVHQPFSGALTGAAGTLLPQRYAGLYTTGFEQASFQPCGSQDQWWVTRTPPELRRSPGTSPFGTVYVEWTARRSPAGRYGHMGRYSRELTPLTVRTLRPGAQCPKQAR